MALLRLLIMRKIAWGEHYADITLRGENCGLQEDRKPTDEVDKHISAKSQSACRNLVKDDVN